MQRQLSLVNLLPKYPQQPGLDPAKRGRPACNPGLQHGQNPMT